MPVFSWARPTPLAIERRIPADRGVYLISDLHLGDGTRSDSFLGKDKQLVRFLDRVRDEDARLVIVGDAIDFHQAWSMSRVLRAHARLMGELARMAESHGVIYIWGNHDYDISLFRDLLRFDVCSTLWIGDDVVVRHGYEYDPFIGPNLDQTHVATRVHHLAERLLDTWIRLPIENFDTRANRVAFWIFHKIAVAVDLQRRVAARLGWPGVGERARRTLWYWTQNQLGNPACMIDGARAFLEGDDRARTLVCGHSHLPGKVPFGSGRTYVNTGSWTFDSAQYAHLEQGSIEVRDWITGRAYGDRAYRHVVAGTTAHLSFLEWWRENYLGRLRYRVMEEGRLPDLGSPEEVDPEGGSA